MQHNIDSIIKLITAFCSALASFLWGNLNGLFVALLCFICLDYITGIIVAIMQKKIDSEIGYKGILKKVLMLIAVAVGHIIDAYVIGSGGEACRNAIIGLYIANEGISIIENTAKVGVKYPKVVTDFLKQLKEKADKEDYDDGEK